MYRQWDSSLKEKQLMNLTMGHENLNSYVNNEPSDEFQSTAKKDEMSHLYCKYCGDTKKDTLFKMKAEWREPTNSISMLARDTAPLIRLSPTFPRQSPNTSQFFHKVDNNFDNEFLIGQEPDGEFFIKTPTTFAKSEIVNSEKPKKIKGNDLFDEVGDISQEEEQKEPLDQRLNLIQQLHQKLQVLRHEKQRWRNSNNELRYICEVAFAPEKRIAVLNKILDSTYCTDKSFRSLIQGVVCDLSILSNHE